MRDDTMDLSTPIAVFEQAIAALNAADWPRVTALCDPVSVRAFHRQLVERFTPREAAHELTVEEYMRHAPEMPRAVAEYHVAQHRRHADPSTWLMRELPDVPDLATLRAMSPEQVFAAWLDARSPLRRIEELAARGEMPSLTDEQVQALKGMTLAYVALGSVADGDRIAHVLYRHHIDAESSADGASRDSTDEDAVWRIAWLAARPEDERQLARELAGREHVQSATCRLQPDGQWRLIAGEGLLQIGTFAFATTPRRVPESET